jgi:hypothetical protein
METVRIRDPGWKKMKIRDKHPGSATLHIGTGSVADPDPGSGAFLTPGSGIRNRFFPDPGSQTHIFEGLVTIFWVKTSIILGKLGQFFLFNLSKMYKYSVL